MLLMFVHEFYTGAFICKFNFYICNGYDLELFVRGTNLDNGCEYAFVYVGY
jgi:hypothetical protein